MHSNYSLPDSPRIVIVGAGFSGIGVAIRLKSAGIDDFIILEKSDRPGGTWRDNTYPGCACDVESLLYSFSFAPNPNWSENYASQPEILSYIEDCISKYDLSPHIHYGIEFQGSRWNDTAAHWDLQTSSGNLQTRALILGLGPLHQPSFPPLTRDAFEGESMHTSGWRHDLDLSGKRIGVIGTGASAIQVVPNIAEQAGELYVFQRTPPWIIPRINPQFPKFVRKFFKYVPFVQRFVRTCLYWTLESRVLAFATKHSTNRILGHAYARSHLKKQIPDPTLRKRFTPSYEIGCKRVLISSDYYPAFTRENVHLVDEAVTDIESTGLKTESSSYPLDIIIYATGFKTTETLSELPIEGRNGITLAQAWGNGASAYLGTSIHGFPNLFLVLGPNTGLGHNSMIFMIEAQADHIIQALSHLDHHRSLEVKAGSERTFSERARAATESTVWSTGCRSWYLDEQGRNVILWPKSTVRFWLQTRRFDPSSYEIE